MNAGGSLMSVRSRRRCAGVASLWLCMTLFLAACADTAARNVTAWDATGCYTLATGAMSWWRPRAWLRQPGASGTDNFALMRSPRTQMPYKWGRTFARDTLPNVRSYANWQQLDNSRVTLDLFDVDWSFVMEWTRVQQDSIVGFVRISESLLPVRARVRGVRIACPDTVVRR